MKIFPLLVLKRNIEYLMLLPFILYGKWKAARAPLKEEYDLICFFPTYGLGGAELVNAHVVTAFPEKKILVVFCKKTSETVTMHLFQHSHITTIDISKFTHKAQSFSNFIYRGVFAAYINRQKRKTVVFNGQCNFGYKILPHLKKDVRKVELIHTSEKKFAWITFPYIPYIDTRVMVGEAIKTTHCTYYRELGIPEAFEDRIQIIFYKIKFYLDQNLARSYTGRLQVCYAGRGGYQKRIHLIVAIIRAGQAAGLPIDFHLAGNYKNELPDDILSSCQYHGFLKAGKEMNDFLQKMDVLLMTSAFEGFPLVIMESMANGVIPVVTAVDAIPEHITNGMNGFLIYKPDDESAVIQQGFDHLAHICANRQSLPEISHNCFCYSKENFGDKQFFNGYADAFGFTRVQKVE